MSHTFSEAELIAARERAGLEVTAFLDDLIWNVKEAVSTMAYQRGVLAATDVEQTLEISVHDELLLHNVDTQLVSNTTESRTKIYNVPNLPHYPQIEVMTETTSDLMFELGYDSDGEPPFLETWS